MMLEQLADARQEALEAIDAFTEELMRIYADHPGLFPKSPKEMAVADKLRFSLDLLSFVEVMEQYK